MANGLINLAWRIYEGYDQPTLRPLHFITKISEQHAGKDPSRRNQEGTLQGNALLGLKPKSHKGMATTPGIPANPRTMKANYGTQTHRCTSNKLHNLSVLPYVYVAVAQR